MTITFYTCSDDPRTISKSLTTVGNPIPDVHILGSCSIMNPSFLLKYSSDILAANYMHASDFGRYYFIEDVIVSPGGRCTVVGREDVLMSNATAILSLDAYSVRSESKVTKMMVDQSIPSLVTTNVTTVNFSEAPFSASNQGDRYILTVKGGKIVSGGA